MNKKGEITIIIIIIVVVVVIIIGQYNIPKGIRVGLQTARLKFICLALAYNIVSFPKNLDIATEQTEVLRERAAKEDLKHSYEKKKQSTET